MSVLQRIRQKVLDDDYVLTVHVRQEMAKDGSDILDVENAILKGRIDKKLTADPRGTRYRLAGQANNGRMIHVICRFDPIAELLLITVYAIDR